MIQLYMYTHPFAFRFLCLLRSAHFSIRCFGSSYYWIVSVLYIFWILTPFRYTVCKYFLPFCRLPFHCFFWCEEAFQFDVVSFDFCFCCLCFCCHIQKIIAQINMEFPSCFLLGVLWCRVLCLSLYSILSYFLCLV